MQNHRTIAILSESPWGCLVLAGLTVVLGTAFVADWLPSSDIPRYWPGHEWIMALLCGLLAALFIYCAIVGFRSRRKS